MVQSLQYILDRDKTIINRSNLFRNKNLLLWYENLYRAQFNGIDNLGKKKILEIGGGTSPLKLFYKNVITTDILDMDHLDYNLDFEKIDKFAAIEDYSVDIITMTDVLHHLRDPITCLEKARHKLKENGMLIIAEPYFSYLSSLVYKFHHEPSIFDISEPKINTEKGPLSGANMAVPFLIFFRNESWLNRIKIYYSFSRDEIIYFSSLSYM
ncbi:MAG: class I SAM-dependent methyltransferase, partial [Candidatus Omnitrophica bacterium]|nr:class I SAM-dependent methyltransferase [Candidatus Omnitrophota bacterium]